MPSQIFGAPAAAVQLYMALQGTAPAPAIYANHVNALTFLGPTAFAISAAGRLSSGDTGLARLVLGNIGISASTLAPADYDALEAVLARSFADHPAARGLVILNLVNILSGLEGHAMYGAVAESFNQKVASAYVQASTTADQPPQASVAVSTGLGGAGGAGTSLRLSVQAGDVVNGTAGNDALNGNLFFNAPSGTFLQTLNNGDALDGRGGVDTLAVAFNNSAPQSIRPALLKSIEHLRVEGNGSANTVIDMSNASGLQTLSVSNGRTPGAAVVLAGLPEPLRSVDLRDELGGVIVRGTAADDASFGSLTLTVQHVGADHAPATVAFPGYADLEVTSGGGAQNFIALADSARTASYSPGATIWVDGDTRIAIFARYSSNPVNVDATELTDGASLSLFADTDANAVEAWGSENDDSFAFGAFYDGRDAVDGGDGIDTLSVSQAAAAGLTANQANLAGIEVLAFSDAVASATYRPRLFGGADTLVLQAASSADYEVVFATGFAALTLQAANTGVATLVCAGSATDDFLLVASSGHAAGGDLLHGDVVTDGFEAVSLVNEQQDGGTSTFGAIFMADRAGFEALYFEGSGAFVVGAITADGIDATELTASLRMTAASAVASADAETLEILGGTGADVLWGSDGADDISGGEGDDTILFGSSLAEAQEDIATGGEGADRFQFMGTSLAGLLRQSSGTSQVVWITDFEAGVDKIVLSIDGAASAGSTISLGALSLAKADSLAAVYAGISGVTGSTTSLAGGATTTAFAGAVVTVDAGRFAGTYLYVNDDVGGAGVAASADDDMLVDITGIAGSLQVSDFLFA
ncbi:bluetail domain-containing putative surface protein [Ramlibacter sp.]|uniref:bluetail domain-containing putative surface protein n=1 Tax=Ramlibacter sp. TaxID=1917967 RepID=UPI003D0C44CF